MGMVTGCKEIDDGCKVTATMYGGALLNEAPNLVSYTGCKPDFHVLVTYDDRFYKMVGVDIDEAKRYSTPGGTAKYVQVAKDSIILNKDSVCKMFNGNGYGTKTTTGYYLKDAVVTGCGAPGCRITGTMHGGAVEGNKAAQGFDGCNAGEVIFVTYDSGFYKMVQTTLADAKASSTPAGPAMHIKAADGSIILTQDTVCKMCTGKGYSSRSSG